MSWTLLALNAWGGARRLGQATVVALLLFFTLLIGLRNEVGGDWFNYLPYVDQQQGAPFAEIFESDEFGYALLNWFGAKWGGGIFLVNSLSALIFSLGLLQFCRAQPRPWLALTLAFPYLVMVVAMGYTRQGVAIGFEFLALLALERGRLLWFIAWVALAATFHNTALVMMVLPAAALEPSLRFRQLIRLGLVAVAGFGLFNALLADSIDSFQSGYLDAGYQSQGALIRVLLCLLPALIFLLNRRCFGLSPEPLRIWSILSLATFLASAALVLGPSSTAVDRISLYLIPLQLFVGSRLPDTRLFNLTPERWEQLLIGFSLAVMLVWLLFAAFSFAWLPYRNLLFF
ncbi:MAG: EpsG family protein [Cyanobium usitatum Tobar12.5m-G36]|nr:EpsG family protein [Cyanobium usitatum Tobar12.5m-G36]